MTYRVLYHKNAPDNLVCVGNEAGLVDINTVPTALGWTFVDAEDGGILAASVFASDKQAEDAIRLFRLPPWVESRALSGVEADCCRLTRTEVLA